MFESSRQMRFCEDIRMDEQALLASGLKDHVMVHRRIESDYV